MLYELVCRDFRIALVWDSMPFFNECAFDLGTISQMSTRTNAYRQDLARTQANKEENLSIIRGPALTSTMTETVIHKLKSDTHILDGLGLP